MSTYDSDRKFTQPAEHIKALNVGPVPQRIFDDMSKYNDTSRGFGVTGFEHSLKNIADAQVSQLYRIPSDTSSTELERLTYFDIGAGRIIRSFAPILGEDWRSKLRAGGALMVMDLTGNEISTLDSSSEATFPKIDGELEIRLTNDNYSYHSMIVSLSNRLLVFASTKENGKDTLVAKPDSKPFLLPSRLIAAKMGEGTTLWTPESISVDDKHVAITMYYGNSYCPLYIVDITGADPKTPELKVKATSYTDAKFSRDPAQAHMLYLITDAFCDFTSVVVYDTLARTVIHITTPEPDLRPLRPVPWETDDLLVTPTALFFSANVEGWQTMYAMPLSVRMRDWEGSPLGYTANMRNDRPNELVVNFSSFRMNGFVALLDFSRAAFHQAAPSPPQFKVYPPKLLKFKSFDGLEVPCMYYHPDEGKTAVPVVINIHGGPESQSIAETKILIHGYLLNELGCAVIYPNVRGSTGYGRRYRALDDVFKREDSVKDIGALLDHIGQNMKNELISSRIAASLVHFSSKLTCGLANFGIANWISFLENTADRRRDQRRHEYGDERNPEIAVPLSIAHGDEDSRVPVDEALQLWDIASKRVYMELMVCELEGHGFRQKSVIEFTNAAKIHFLERFLLPNANASSHL
ncbi:alpha beta-hydrolase [Russula vinacea]|nr:alpha beta-hydrolase [Russula vinacea]